MSVGLAPAGVQAILLDVEGTTTPIAFVVETLVPYARTHLRRYVEQHASAPEYARLLEQLRGEHAADREAGQPVPAWVDTPAAAHLASVVGYLEWLMDRDRKSTALKDLQGRVWEEGYRLGELQGDVFADVPRALERWRAQGLEIGIFSSGSVLAQQLLFRHSSAGDLTGHLRWHFDTTSRREGGRRQLSPHRRGDDDPATGRAVHIRRCARARCGPRGGHADAPVSPAWQCAATRRPWPRSGAHVRRRGVSVGPKEIVMPSISNFQDPTSKKAGALRVGSLELGR